MAASRLDRAPHEAAVTSAVAKLNCPEGVPVLSAQAAGALLRLLEGARERRRDREERRKAPDRGSVGCF